MRGQISVDGASTNPDKCPLVNVVLSTPNYARVMEVRDTTGATKNKEYISSLIQDNLEKLGKLKGKVCATYSPRYFGPSPSGDRHFYNYYH